MRFAWEQPFLGKELSVLGQLALSPGRPRKVLIQAYKCLKFEGLPAAKQLLVKVPEPCLVQPCKKLLRDLAWNSGKWPPEIIRWVLAKTLVVVCKAPKFKDHLSHANAAKKFRLKHALSLDQDFLASAIQGTGLTKALGNINVKIHMNLENKIRSVQLALGTWSRQACLGSLGESCSQPSFAKCVASHRAVQASLKRNERHRVEYEKLARDMRAVGKKVLVPDDKEKTACGKSI